MLVEFSLQVSFFEKQSVLCKSMERETFSICIGTLDAGNPVVQLVEKMAGKIGLSIPTGIRTGGFLTRAHLTAPLVASGPIRIVHSVSLFRILSRRLILYRPYTTFRYPNGPFSSWGVNTNSSPDSSQHRSW